MLVSYRLQFRITGVSWRLFYLPEKPRKRIWLRNAKHLSTVDSGKPTGFESGVLSFCLVRVMTSVDWWKYTENLPMKAPGLLPGVHLQSSAV